MTIIQADLVPYRIRLRSPAAFGGERIGRLVRLEADDGSTGWGEAAPLPGFSRDSIGQVDAEWDERRDDLTSCDVPPFDFARPTHITAGQFQTVSLRFAIEQALVALTAKRAGLTLPEFVAPNGPRSVKLAGLVTEGGEKALDEATRLVAAGYQTLKIKAGRAGLEDDVTAVLAMRDAVGPDVGLRVDPNRAWTLREAVRFVRDTAGVDLEFIEEPLQDPSQLRHLFEETGASVALDETLTAIEAWELADWRFATHVVVKPTLLGGILRCEHLVRTAGLLGLQSVVSAAYESGLGTAMLVCLAARWCPGEPAAGLDTYRQLASDLLADRLEIGPETYLEGLSFQPDPGLATS